MNEMYSECEMCFLIVQGDKEDSVKQMIKEKKSQAFASQEKSYLTVAMETIVRYFSKFYCIIFFTEGVFVTTGLLSSD